MQYRLHRRFIPWLVAHTFEYIHYYIGAIACLYYLHYFSSEIPIMAKNLGDAAVENKLAETNIFDFILLALYIIFFRTLSRLLFFYPARIQQRNLRMELVNRLEKSFPRNYQDYNEGMIFQSLYNDLNRLRGFVGFALLQFGNIVIASLIFIPKIREFNPDFLIAFSPLALCIVLFSIIIYFFQPFMKRGMDEYAQVQNFLLESYEAKKTIQNYHSEQDFYNFFNEKSDKELRTFFISTLGRVISFPMVKLGIGASLIWGAIIVRDQNLSGSDLIFFSSFLFLIIEPLMFMSWIGVVTSQGYAAWTRTKEMIAKLDQKIDDSFFREDNPLETPELPLWGKNLKLEFILGKWSILIGETGSGKSWLLEKYAELLTLQKKEYSFIHQEPYLYNDTVEGNIFLGQEITEAKAQKAKFYLKEFGLDVLSESLDSLMKMELGENGKRVSGGQAKRIALIRSLISDVNYILWDDPFSSVDLILEAEIIKRLKSDEDLKDKTFIVTSHRISTVRESDYIIYIDKEHGLLESGETNKILNTESKIDEFFSKQMV